MPTRRHDMPFGAQTTPEGVRFRLWAPSCRQVRLCLEGGQPGPALPMAGCGDGWFELTVAGARAGARYRFEVGDGQRVPDPASRCNPDDVDGASEVIDPDAFSWQDGAWTGRPWPEAVGYELHVGAFSPEGSFDGVVRRLDYLADLGVTAIELMPVADFPGARNWGYDGVLPFAPDSRYGRPDQLKALVQAAHGKGLMVFLDVVYNHFGPQGNHLDAYAGAFFNPDRATPWGAAIDFRNPAVREFFIHNALYWLEEYHFDGLRLDAVHAIHDPSGRHILAELADRVRAGVGAGRQVHLILENDANQASLLGPGRYTAQWNDDFHHALHVLGTGERDGYYADYARDPIGQLGRCLAEGFAYQGEASPCRDQAPRGEPSAQLPPQAFVTFLQCHDQVGNRAFGERITSLAPAQAVRAAAAIWLLAPAIPMLFMGEEFAAASPFLFFCDFQGDLGGAVTRGRRREFSQFARFSDPATLATIPDPNLESTFLRSRLPWDSLDDPEHAHWLAYYRALLKLRREVVVPRLAGMGGRAGSFERIAPAGLRVAWRMGDGSTLLLLANGSSGMIRTAAPGGTAVFATSPEAAAGELGPWAVAWTLADSGGAS
ncbi:MAG: malto-oligosyltrehalose trehalohydrolase [Holophaga sp.]|nr:malto-oligosyltrehalose trehalohydrolase [Holophaga sp.]